MSNTNQVEENKRRKKAIERENDFLKDYVIDKGAETSTQKSKNNKQTNIEKSVEDKTSSTQ